MALIDELKEQGFVQQDEIDAAQRLGLYQCIRAQQRLALLGLERRRREANERLRRLSEGS